MPIRVHIPDVGAVNFPDEMSPDEIHSTVDQIYSQQVIESKPPGMPAPGPNPIQQEIENQRAGTLAGFPGASPSVPDSPAAMVPGAIALGTAGLIAGGPTLLTAARSPIGRTALKYGLGGSTLEVGRRLGKVALKSLLGEE